MTKLSDLRPQIWPEGKLTDRQGRDLLIRVEMWLARSYSEMLAAESVLSIERTDASSVSVVIPPSKEELAARHEKLVYLWSLHVVSHVRSPLGDFRCTICKQFEQRARIGAQLED